MNCDLIELSRLQHFRKGDFDKCIEIYELLLSQAQEVIDYWAHGSPILFSTLQSNDPPLSTGR